MLDVLKGTMTGAMYLLPVFSSSLRPFFPPVKSSNHIA